MRNRKMKSKKFRINAKGITLIALVITIIVLLILAGVTIATLTGENGILTRANDAKEKTEQAEKDEKTNLSRTEDIINQYVDGIEVEQVTDTNPGVLEAEGTDTYVINSIEDLVAFASNVREGNTYEGQTVKLGLNLDFNSTKSYVDPFSTDYGEYGYDGDLKTLLTSGEGFKPIGTTAIKSDSTVKDGNFAGIFDGNNCILANCYMNKDVMQMEESYGMALFGRYLYGEVKNLGLINVNFNLVNLDKECYVSGIVVANMQDCKISNCYVTGNIKQISNGIGNVNCSGISVYNRGKIDGCHNSAEIIGEINDSTLTGGCYIGGIVVNQQGNSIVNCYNNGNLIAKGSGSAFNLGGIARIIVGVDTKIEKSYNAGKLTLEVVNGKNNAVVGRNCCGSRP